ncbi:MAG: TRAP transporter small permease [Pseudomonadota bacterium]|nr:TRAP transporter small permease [Pseudomonadota bacterium]
MTDIDIAPRPPRRGRDRSDLLGPVLTGLNALGSVWIMGLMFLICGDILMRTVFNAPIAGVAEMVTFSIVGIVFLQLAHTLRAGSMTRSDLLITMVKRRSPRAAGLLLAFFSLVGAALLIITLWYFFPIFQKAWTQPERNFMGNPGFFRIPTWPLYGLMCIGMAATILEYVAQAWRYAREGA